MILSIINADRKKLKRAPLWLAFIFMPIIPALLGTLNYSANLEILENGLFFSADNAGYLLLIFNQY